MLVDMKNFIDTGLIDSDSINLFGCEDRMWTCKPIRVQSVNVHLPDSVILVSDASFILKGFCFIIVNLSFFTEQNKKKPLFEFV